VRAGADAKVAVRGSVHGSIHADGARIAVGGNVHGNVENDGGKVAVGGRIYGQIDTSDEGSTDIGNRSWSRRAKRGLVASAALATAGLIVRAAKNRG
jgi:hypothetical protein